MKPLTLFPLFDEAAFLKPSPVAMNSCKNCFLFEELVRIGPVIHNNTLEFSEKIALTVELLFGLAIEQLAIRGKSLIACST